MNVAFLPTYPNPYQHLLAGALARQGVVVEMLPRLPSVAWLRSRRAEVDILHFHWLHGLYMEGWRTPATGVAFLRRFRLARELGYGVVWTAHNALPHRAVGLHPLHVAIRRLMMAEAGAVIVHCVAAREELTTRFPRSLPVAVIPPGHYGGLYPRIDRQTARAALGIAPTRFAYLSLGNIAVYKGLERFATTFAAAGSLDDVALIAGRNRDAAVVRKLQRAAARDARIHLAVGFVPDEQMGTYLAAADAMVAPFERILTSSTVITGLSHGLPIITPDLGCMPELVGDAGLVYGADDPDALRRALISIKSADLGRMSASALARSAAMSWDDAARETVAVYRAVQARSR